MNILCVIPARLGSTRLSRKPLAMIGNKTMVQRTYEAACQCQAISKVVVATDNEEVAEVIRQCGGTVEMTDENIKTGSDRVAIVAKRYPEMDVIINLQGDEPFMQAGMLSTLVQPFLTGDNPPLMATLAAPLDVKNNYTNPDMVKVICDKNNDAIYFSRSPLPYFREQAPKPIALHHMGIYAFTREFLQIYTSLPQTALEQAELLEQLRAIEHGYKIRVCKVAKNTLEINSPEDLEKAQALVANETLNS